MIVSADRIIIGDKNEKTDSNAILIKDGIIKQMGMLKDLMQAYPEEVIDSYPNTTLMPGMIDMHVHPGFPISLEYMNHYNGESMRALHTASKMHATLLGGVTTVRDCGSPDGLATAIKKVAADGFIKAPRVIASHSALAITGGHGVAVGMNTAIEIDGVDEVRKAIRKNLKNGADCIKLMNSEGYRGQEFNQDELDAAVEEAHRFGVKVAVHAGYGDSMEMSIEAGVDSIEHGTNLTLEQAKWMKGKGIAWIPTVFVFNYGYAAINSATDSVLSEFLLEHKVYLEESVNAYKNNLRKLYDTGVIVATGTDTDCLPFNGASPVYKECECLVDCGLTPMEAIECATKNGAQCLGMGDKLGQIKKGYIADIALVKGNPLEDIVALGDVQAVYQSGIKV